MRIGLLPALFDPERSITIAGRAVPLIVRRIPRARRMTLRVDAVRGAVALALPPGAPLREGLRFVALQQAWIAGRLAAAPPVVRLVPGACFALEGMALTIDWAPGHGRCAAVMDDRLVVGGAEASVERRVVAWLKDRARTVMAADAADYAPAAGVDPPRVILSDPMRRWGSCSSRGVVRLSWRLVMAPPMVRRSVVAHEVAHLRHMNHSPAFHALVRRMFEGDVGAADRWLRRHGVGLHRVAPRAGN